MQGSDYYQKSASQLDKVYLKQITAEQSYAKGASFYKEGDHKNALKYFNHSYEIDKK